MSAVLVAIVTMVTILFVKYHWDRRKLYAFSMKVHGPVALPIIGNGLLFTCKFVDIYENLILCLRRYPHPMRLWMGPKLMAVFTDLSHVEKIMSSTKIAHKGEIYKFIADVAGIGLITASGPQWRDHRRVIQPMFNLNYVFSRVNCIQKHCNRLLNIMDQLVDAGTVNIWSTYHHCCFDIVSEIINGINLGLQDGKNLHVIKHFEDFYDNIFGQMVKPWLHVPLIFNNTVYKTERDRIKNGLASFFMQIIEKSRSRLKTCNEDKINALPIVDQINIALRDKPDLMDDSGLIEHLITLFAASEDPATLITCAASICFGMYPEYQKIAAEEIREVIGETPREVADTDLPNFKYLEMCINEVLRLFPIGPFVLRRCTEEISLKECTIPVGCDVLIPIDVLHRDPEQWEHPNDFYPDHFLHEAVAKRNPYTYIPFSSGPRKCIGKHMAMQLIKIIMANLLQRFSFEAHGKYPDLKFKTDISLRVVNGYKVKVFRREWN